jgi:sugar (pentulose or hexulose) kinase
LRGLALGIDIGTSGARVCALDHEGAVVARSAVAMPAPRRHGQAVRQDARVWWTAARKALAQIADAIDRRAVRALAVDGTSGSVLAVDEVGTPLAPARMYNETAAADAVEAIAAVAPETTAARGGSSALARAIGLQAQRSAARILHQADWIAGQLSGRFDVTDENNALKTGYDPVARRWPDWIAQTGMRVGLLPAVVPAGTRIGALRRAAAESFGLPPETAVVAGTTDGCAAFLATGAAQTGDGVTSLGSTLTLKLLTGEPVFAPSFGIYSHRIGEAWLAGGASNSGGAVLLSFFSKRRLQSLEGRLDPVHPTGLDYYPLAAAGERFPFNDPTLAPRVTPRPSDDHVFLQGLLEGIAAIEALGYRRLAELGATPLKALRTVGGGAANQAWARIRQARLGVPFLPARADEAAAGAARLAWCGLGVEVGA